MLTIARGLSPFNSEDVAIEASRLMLQRIELLLEREESFSIKTFQHIPAKELLAAEQPAKH